MASGAAMSDLPVEETAVHDIELLLARKTDEVHRVAGDANRELRIFVRMLHRIEQRLLAEHVEIQMESALSKVHVDRAGSPRDRFRLALPVLRRDDRERVADAVARFGVRQARDRQTRREPAVRIASVHWVGAWRERLALAPAVRRVAGGFSVNDVRGNRQ